MNLSNDAVVEEQLETGDHVLPSFETGIASLISFSLRRGHQAVKRPGHGAEDSATSLRRHGYNADNLCILVQHWRAAQPVERLVWRLGAPILDPSEYLVLATALPHCMGLAQQP